MLRGPRPRYKISDERDRWLASSNQLWDRARMQRAWLLAGGGAVIGGVVGASLGIALTRPAAPAAEVMSQTGTGQVGALESKLVGRVEALEHSVRELEIRRDAARSPMPAARLGGAAPASEGQRPTPPPMGTPRG